MAAPETTLRGVETRGPTNLILAMTQLPALSFD